MTVISLEEPELVQEVRLLVQQDNTAAQDFVAEAVRRYLVTYRQKKIMIETEAWHNLPSAERQQYVGQFVAVCEGQVVDADPDRLTLYHRVREHFGRRPVLITEGGDYPIPVYYMRSPRHGR